MAFVVALAALVLVGTACDPIVHPVLTEVEPPGPAWFRALSTDGDYAFVQSSAAGTTVPGAGTWRVDRRDGTTVAVPATNVFSQDGHRVRSGSQIWEDGVLTSLPNGGSATPSKDLRWAIWHDPATQRYRRWSLATGSDVPIDASYPVDPNPPFPSAGGLGISDDGNVAWFPIDTPAGCATRFVFLAQDWVFDHPTCTLTVAASGTAFAALADPVTIFVPQHYGFFGYQQVELWQTVRPEAPARVLEPAVYSNVTLADGGWTLWAVGYEGSSTYTPVNVVAATPDDLESFPITAPAGNVDVDVTPDGRWLAFTGGCVGNICSPKGPAAVVDRLNDQVEWLDAGPTAKGNIALSGDGELVAYTGDPLVLGFGRGWFEQTPGDAPGL